MERLMENKIMKIALSTIILFSMLISYVLPISFAAPQPGEEESDFVQIAVQDLGRIVNSNINIPIGISTAYTGVQTGFKNVSVFVSSVDASGTAPSAQISCDETEDAQVVNGDGFVEIKYGNVATGTSKLTGVIVNFPTADNFLPYQKSLLIEVVGQYKNPETGELESFYETKTVTTNVKSTNEEFNFDASLELDPKTANTLYSTKKDFTYDSKNGYYRDSYSHYSNIILNSGLFTNKIELKYTIYRSDYRTGFMVNFSKLIEDGFELTDVNGDEEGDSNGKSYTSGIEGKTVSQGWYAYSVVDNWDEVDGIIEFTLTKEADSTNLEDAFSIKDKKYLIIAEMFTGIENNCWETYGYGKYEENWQGPTISYKATGYDYSRTYNDDNANVEENTSTVTKEGFVKANDSSTYVYDYPTNAQASISNIAVRNRESKWVNETQIENDPIYYNARIEFDNSSMYGDNATISNMKTRLTYTKDDGKVAYLELNSDNSSLDSVSFAALNFEHEEYINESITIPAYSGQVQLVRDSEVLKTFVNDNNELVTNDSWTSDNGKSDFVINIANQVGSGNVTLKYKTSYEELREAGLTDSEIKRGLDFAIYYEVVGSYTVKRTHMYYVVQKYNVNGNCSYTSIVTEDLNEKYSYLNSWKNKTLKLNMEKPSSSISQHTDIQNDNAIFYVKLDEDFEYKNPSVTINNLGGAKETADIKLAKEPYYKEIKGQLYIVIETEGRYTSYDNNNVEIILAYNRRLINPDAEANKTLEVYMLTDNDIYFEGIENTEELTKDDEIPSTIFKMTKDFTITDLGELSNKTRIIKKVGFIKHQYKSELSNEIDDQSEANNPVVFTEGDSVEYEGSLINQFEYDVSNVELMFRLPVANNKNVLPEKNTTTYKPILEQNFELPDEFINNHKNLVNITAGEPVNALSLTGLSDIVVKIGTKTLNTSEYTIYYSTSDTAGFDVTNTAEYTAYVTGDTNIANAKTIVARLNSDLPAGKTAKLSFKMTMPAGDENNGMAGAMFGSQYDYVDVDEVTHTTKLDSEAVYVVKGKKGEIDIQKTFEGLSNNATPSWLTDKSGIQFKLKVNYGLNYVKDKYDNDEDGDTTEDLVIVTDSTGKAVVKKIDDGIYQLEEISTVQGFEEPSQVYDIEIEDGQIVNINVENKLKTVPIKIIKTWDNTNKIKDEVWFKVTRTNNDGINFSENVKTNSEGIATIEVPPYGEYKVEEISTKYGWYAEPVENIQITNEEEPVNVNVLNKIAKGNIVIQKTVPTGDTVDGLAFNVKSSRPFTYTNTAGETIKLDVDLDIDADVEKDDEQAKVEISEDRAMVTITVKDVPLGLYTITETEVPTITNSQNETIERYERAKGTVSISENGENANVILANLWKMGKIRITKKAEEGIDLTKFAFRVQGTSYYNTPIDRTYYMNSTGVLTATIEIGKYTITEIENNAFEATYSYDDVTYSEDDSIDVEVESKGISNVFIKNELQYGYVKVIKTLEGRPASAAKGIKFYVKGTDPFGTYITKEIVIGDNGEGISESIPAGGEYVLVEDDTTTPKYYIPAEEMSIEITKEHKENSPLVISRNNKRGIGNLQIKTETYPENIEGGLPYPIVYKYAEIELDDKGEPKLDGNNDIVLVNGTEKTLQADLQGEAYVPNLPAGLYMVWQESIPAEWEKDVKQIAEVPANDTGIAIFQITKKDELRKNKVVISKQIYNWNNQLATAEDFETAQLDANESFEIKLKNTETLETFYTFVSTNKKADNTIISKNGTIVGLTPGKYEIEEIERFKYENIGIYNNDATISELQKENGKYVIEIPDVENATLELIVKNKINLNFGFGGSTHIDNPAKNTLQSIQNTVVTKSVINIVDEDGKILPGVQFRVLNSNNEEVQISAAGNTITTTSNRVTLKGLEAGEYTVDFISVPQGYIKPENVSFNVYEDASRVIRIEVQENIARGGLLLSTYYLDENENEHFTANSKYKVLNTETNEFVTFTKKSDGTYIKSNLPTAVDTISLRQGVMRVSGIEAGNYDIGLVDVNDEYGIVKKTVENIDIVNNTNQEVKVQVEEKQIIDAIIPNNSTTLLLDSDGKIWKVASNNAPVCLSDQTNNAFNDTKLVKLYSDNSSQGCGAIDEDGKVWIWSENRYSSGSAIYKYNSRNSTEVACISNDSSSALNGIKAVDMTIRNDRVVIIDELGKVYTWGNKTQLGMDYNYENSLTNEQAYTLHCISTEEQNAILKNVKIKKVASTYNTVALIDENGKVWTWSNGSNPANGYTAEETTDYYKPQCISDIPRNPIAEAYKRGIKIVDIKGDSNGMFVALDSQGKLWTWGNNNSYGALGNNTTTSSTLPICISEEQCNLEIANLKFTNISVGEYGSALAVDEYGRVWVWGQNYYKMLGTEETDMKKPMCISDDSTEPLNGVIIERINGGYEGTIAFDRDGKVWSWGYNYYRNLGSKTNHYSNDYNYKQPSKAEFIITYDKNFDYNLEIVKVSAGYYHVVMLDKNGRVWATGYRNYSGAATSDYGSETYNVPTPVDVDKNVTFVDVATGYNNTILLDSEGKVWTTGSYSTGLLGYQTSTYADTFKCISEINGNPLNGVKVEKIYVDPTWNYSLIAIDSDGKVWTWGNDSLGRSKTPVCLTTTDANLNAAYGDGTRFVSASVCNNVVALLDNNGKVWTYKSSLTGQESNKYTCITDINNEDNELYAAYRATPQSRAVEVGVSYYGICVIDSLGKIFYAGSSSYPPQSGTTSQYFKCLSDASDSIAYGLYYNDNVEFRKLEAGYQSMYLVDNDGKLWTFGYSYPCGCSSVYLTCLTTKTDISLYNRKLKNVFAGYDVDMFIDENGDIWVSGSGNYNRLGTGSTGNVYSPQSLFSSIKNRLYQVKIIGFNYSKDPIDENKNIWSLNGTAAISGTYVESEKEDLQARLPNGVTIKEFVGGSGSNCSYGIDSEGKLWFSGYMNGLNNEYFGIESGVSLQQFTVAQKFIDEGIKIINIEAPYLLGDDGKLYSMSRYSAPDTFEANTSIVDMKWMQNEQVMLYKDSVGNIWARGNNRYGSLGIGVYGNANASTVSTPAKVNFGGATVDIDLDNIYSNIGNSTENGLRHLYFVENDGSAWITGIGQSYQCGTGTNSNKLTPCKIKTSANQIIYPETILDYTYSTYILDKSGDIWHTGGNGTDLSENNYAEYAGVDHNYFTKLNVENKKFKKLVLQGKWIFAIDSNDEIWGLKVDDTGVKEFTKANSDTTSGLLINQLSTTTCRYADNNILQTSDGKIYTGVDSKGLITSLGTDKTIESSYKSNYLFIKFTDGTAAAYSTYNSAEYEVVREMSNKDPKFADLTAKEIGNYVSNTYCFIGEDGKLYIKGMNFKDVYYDNNHIICASDIEGTEIYGKTLIAATYYNSSLKVVDSNNNLYVTGNYSDIGLEAKYGSGSTTTPINITQIDDLKDPILNHGWYIVKSRLGM